MPAAKLLDSRGRALPASAPRPGPAVRARYDAAQADADGARHWSNSDGLSARAANDPRTRRLLRNRARYEAANNSYCRGIVLTLANDCIGTGPRLQLRTPDEDANARVAAEFDAWAAGSGLAEKLRTMRQARAVDGEAFALLATNEKLPTPVKLDLRLVEADQFATPVVNILDPLAVDGLELDGAGNPTFYHLLPYHPGDLFALALPTQYERVPAADVLHWFRADRPQQYRGVPEVTPALPLFAQLRRFTLAVLAAAETAADFAAVLYSEMPPDGEAADADPFETLDIAKRMMTTLPAGWKLGQFRAEQPAATYEMFKRELINEIARCLNVPFNVAAGNSSNYNYASGRLDHQVYFKSIAVDQYHIECAVLDRVLAAWLAEARLAMPGLVPAGPGAVPPHCWFWDGPGHADPLKEANAEQVRLASGTTTLADAWARQGHDWRDRLRQRAAEVALMRQLGLEPFPTQAPTPVADPNQGEDSAAQS